MIFLPWTLWFCLLSLQGGKWASGSAKLPSLPFHISLSFSFLVSVGLWQKRAGRQIQSSRTAYSDVRLFVLAGASQGSGLSFSASLVNFLLGCQHNSSTGVMDKDVNLREKLFVLVQKAHTQKKKISLMLGSLKVNTLHIQASTAMISAWRWKECLLNIQVCFQMLCPHQSSPSTLEMISSDQWADD